MPLTEPSQTDDATPGHVASTDRLGVAPKRCTDRVKCQGDDTRYDTVGSGVYSLTLKCRACGFIIRHDWD